MTCTLAHTLTLHTRTHTPPPPLDTHPHAQTHARTLTHGTPYLAMILHVWSCIWPRQRNPKPSVASVVCRVKVGRLLGGKLHGHKLLDGRRRESYKIREMPTHTQTHTYTHTHTHTHTHACTHTRTHTHTHTHSHPGEFSHDLPFCKGEQLTVLEPCNRLFWYLAQNEQGRRGVIPITFVQVGGTVKMGGTVQVGGTVKVGGRQ